VPTGSIPLEAVTIPGIYVDRVVVHDRELGAAMLEDEKKRRERRPRPVDPDRVGLTQELIALRAARMLQPGQYVNLGMGIPVRVANFISPESGVTLHSENGFLGYGPEPSDDEYEWHLYNAIGQPVTALPGASVFDSVQAFTMARGGHLDVVILGGLQVSVNGDLANWWAPFMAAGGMGGAMDLCTDVPELIVLMEHTTRDGEPKILNECVYPLTAKACVTRIVTELAYIDVTPGGLVVRELAPGVTPEYVQERTEPTLRFADDCREMDLGEA
jgi:3-oxoacid CoA-transferase subunit B